MTALLTLADALATHARLAPGRLAARDSRRSLSWRGWDERATRLANGLLAAGLQKGDRVAVLAYNRLEWLEIYAGLGRAGLVAVPVNFRLLAPEVAYIVGHAEARAVICEDALVDRFEPRAVPHGVGTQTGAGESTGDATATGVAANGWFVIGEAERPGWRRYEALVTGASAAPVLIDVQPEDTFALMYTSGTTGRPKGVVRSHAGNALLAFATALEFGLGRADTGLLVMPMCHANSLYFGLTFLYLGATIVVDDRRSFDPEALLAALAREKVTFTSLVPTHYIMMLGLPEAVKKRHDVSAVGKLLISSAPARADTKRAILGHFANSRLFELYGSTEAGWVTILRPDEQIERIGSVGREWAGSGAIRLLDADGREVADGEIGELFSRTSYVFDGYWKNAEKTAEAFRDGSCSVGDMARRDHDGYIHLVDRKSNMIISGGENIYPSEVEAVIGAHPHVKDVAVVGLPDAKWGEAVCAVVVARDGHAPSEEKIVAWCRDRMAGFKRPRSVIFVAEDEMPRTATGKILHRTLRERLAKATVAA